MAHAYESGGHGGHHDSHGHDRQGHEHEHLREPAPEVHEEHAGHGHEAMIEDYKKRLIVSVVLTVPVIILSPSVQSFLGYRVEIPGANVYSGCCRR